MRNFLTLFAVISALAGPAACGSDLGGAEATPNASARLTGKADQPVAGSLPADFPRAQDLAVLFPLHTERGIAAKSTTASGRALLAREWVDQVSDAYLDTEVADALEVENLYSDWRIVALRFVPCGPLGIMPSQEPGTLCWPQVRIVWQPVLENIQVSWMMRPYYADDRAIHALYHVMPPGAEGDDALRSMREFLSAGGRPEDLDATARERFMAHRNDAIDALVSRMAQLRGPGVTGADLEDLDIRAELWTYHDQMGDAFTRQLEMFLGEVCEPERLFELTSFSLPEGRDPATLDHWSFIAFEGVEGQLIQKDITVVGADSGAIIGHGGLVEDVSQSTADPELEDGLDDAQHAAELEASAIFDAEDIDRLGDRISDPTQTLVPNTTCASCHKLNPLRFDFHNLSHLEDREVTISPRVVRDVEHEIRWLNAALGR